MSGKIDVANYENQLLLASARKKIQEELKQHDDGGKAIKQKTAAGILTSKEMDLLNYVNDDFKKLLVLGAKGRSEKVVKHLEHVMSLSEAMKCVELGTGSYGGHIARSVKAPGPTNGHNIVRPHERIHSLDGFTAQETRNLITRSKDLQHAPFDPDPEGGALSVGRHTLNLHDFDVDLQHQERNNFVQEIEQFNRVLETRRRLKEDERSKLDNSIKHWENSIKEKQRLRRRSEQHATVTDDSIGMRFPQFGSLLELPMPMESREVMYSDHYLREKQHAVQSEASQKAAEELEARKTGEIMQEQEAILSLGQSHTEEEARKIRADRKRKRLWRFFLTKLHKCCEDITTQELDDLACMVCPSELISNMIYYICLVLGITPEWHAAKRSIFKEANSFVSFLQAVNPLDIPERRLRKAIAFKNESNISNLSVQQAVRSCSLPVIERLCNWVLNFDALASFIIAIEGKKHKFSAVESQLSLYDPTSSFQSGSRDAVSAEKKEKTLSPKSVASIKDIMIPVAQRKAMFAAMHEKSLDLQAENKRHEELVQRASRKYKHCGLRIIDVHEVLKSKLSSPPVSPVKKKPRVVIDYSILPAPSSSKPASPVKKKKPVKVSLMGVVEMAMAPRALLRVNSSSSLRPETRPQSALSHFDTTALLAGLGSFTSFPHDSDSNNNSAARAGLTGSSKKWDLKGDLIDGSDVAWQKMANAAKLPDENDVGQVSPNIAANDSSTMDEGDDYADEFMKEDEAEDIPAHHTYLPIWDDPAPAVHSTAPRAKSPSPIIPVPVPVVPVTGEQAGGKEKSTDDKDDDGSDPYDDAAWD